MVSIILKTSVRYLMPLLILFSFYMLLRGHNAPGGGFIGGLLAAAAFILLALAEGITKTKTKININPQFLIGIGLLIALGSGIISFFTLKPFMTGLWIHTSLPLLGEIHLGTPLLFDLGVFFVVIGITTHIIFTLAEE